MEGNPTTNRVPADPCAFLDVPVVSSASPVTWSYEEAFGRNVGLISPEEQQRLRNSRVAIIGTGGVGGIHLATLTRTGIGRFTIADPDTFEVANFNRQFGATLPNLGRPKVEVMAEEARAINPALDIRVFNQAITPDSAADFLDGAEVLLDGVDFFCFDIRRMIFREAQQRGIWAITAGPIGFSAAWLVFDSNGMGFDEYFDLHAGMAPVDQFAAFAIGVAPAGTQFTYIDLSQVEGGAARGPSAVLACNLCAGVAAAETVKILLGRDGIRPAPHYAQFDAYRRLFRRGRLLWGNRGPLQRIKRSILRRRMVQLGYASAAP